MNLILIVDPSLIPASRTFAWFTTGHLQKSIPSNRKRSAHLVTQRQRYATCIMCKQSRCKQGATGWIRPEGPYRSACMYGVAPEQLCPKGWIQFVIPFGRPSPRRSWRLNELSQQRVTLNLINIKPAPVGASSFSFIRSNFCGDCAVCSAVEI